jgi:hypothetical protein
MKSIFAPKGGRCQKIEKGPENGWERSSIESIKEGQVNREDARNLHKGEYAAPERGKKKQNDGLYTRGKKNKPCTGNLTQPINRGTKQKVLAEATSSIRDA